MRVGAIVLAVYVGLIGTAGFEFARTPTGFIPEQDQGYLISVVQLPAGATLDRTEKSSDAVSTSFWHDGHRACGALCRPRRHDLHGRAQRRNDLLRLAVTLRSRASGRERRTPCWPTCVSACRSSRTPSGDDPAAAGAEPRQRGGFKMMLEDRAELGPQALEKAARALVAAANKDPAFAGVFTLFNTGSPSIYADIDRVKAEKVGLTPSDVFSTLQVYLGSQYVNDFNYLGRTYQVRVQSDEQFRLTPQDIAHLRARNASGEMVPIGTVAQLRSKTIPYRVPRYNLFPAAEVQGERRRASPPARRRSAWKSWRNKVLPKGITFEWTDLAFQQQLRRTPTLLVFGAAALFVFLVLVAQYESWKLPLAIVLIVPMCLLASVTGLLARGMPIDILTQIGFVVLIGLAAKNAIRSSSRAPEAEEGAAAGERVHAARTRLPHPMLARVVLGSPTRVATGARECGNRSARPCCSGCWA